MNYNVFKNVDLSGNPVDSGSAFTSYDVDFTVKVEAKNLKAYTKYWYQFADCADSATVSPVGTTRTIAHYTSRLCAICGRTPTNLLRKAPASKVNSGKPLTLAVFSCSQYQNGASLGAILCWVALQR